MNFLSLIENKREGKILASKQIQEFIREFTADYFSDSKIFSAAAFGFSAA
jgi:thymidine phosphorylase